MLLARFERNELAVSKIKNNKNHKSMAQKVTNTAVNTLVTLIGTGTFCAICFTFYTIFTVSFC